MKSGGVILSILICSLVEKLTAFCPETSYVKYSGKVISSNISPSLSHTTTSWDKCRVEVFVQHKTTYVSYDSSSGNCNYYIGSFNPDTLVSNGKGIVGVSCAPKIGVCGSEGSRTEKELRYDGNAIARYSQENPEDMTVGKSRCKRFGGNFYTFEIMILNGICLRYNVVFDDTQLIPNENGYVVTANQVREGVLYSSNVDSASVVYGRLGTFAQATALCRADGQYSFYSIEVTGVRYECQRFRAPLDLHLLVPDEDTTATFPCIPGCTYAGFREYPGKIIKSWVIRTYTSYGIVGTGMSQFQCEKYVRVHLGSFYSLQRKNERELLCYVFLHEFQESYMEDSDDDVALTGVQCAKSWD